MAASSKSPPPVMRASLDGPPLEAYTYTTPSTTTAASFPDNSGRNTTSAGVPMIQAANETSANLAAGTRSFSRSPVRTQLRSASNPVGNHALNSVRSNPVLLPSRQAGSVKHIANKFDQGAAAAGAPPPPLRVQTTQERYRRARVDKPRSPTGAKGEAGMVKLQKRRPGQPKSPQRSPATSFETNGSSFSFNATLRSSRSQPQSASSPKRARSPVKKAAYPNNKPLFGELTADGWHGNFALPSYGEPPSFEATPRRGSDGSIALGHGRSQSHQNITRKALSPPINHKLQHKRSRSEMDTPQPQTAPSMPNPSAYRMPDLYPTPPNSGTRNELRKDSPTSRLPVSSRRQSQDSAGGTSSAPYSRSASAMSNRERSRLSKSPTRMKQAFGKENNAPVTTPRSRYQPAPLSSAQSGQTLSAKIVAPPAKTSPPLRSSRPRQPVSAATTSASRARAAERFQNPPLKDSRRPSEQWLGKPYDPQKERTRRKIPELGKVDFAERRARIQKAISQNLEENEAKESLVTRSRQASVASEQAFAGADHAALNAVDEKQARILDEETAQIEEVQPVLEPNRPRGLSVNTSAVPLREGEELEPKTAATDATEFEVDESPILGRLPQQAAPAPEPSARIEIVPDEPVLLSAATYQPPARPFTPPSQRHVEDAEPPQVQSPSILENIRRMRERSESSLSRDGTDFPDDSPSADDSPSDIEDRWGLAHGLGNADQGSIQIMLDGDSAPKDTEGPWSKGMRPQHYEQSSRLADHEALYQSDGFVDSPVENGTAHSVDEASEATPRKPQRDDTIKPGKPASAMAFTATSQDLEQDAALARAFDDYQTNGRVAPEILEYIQGHSVDLQRLSANGGSDAHMVQNLLDSMLDARAAPVPALESASNHDTFDGELLLPMQYEIPPVTPDTPPDAAMAGGTALVYSQRTSFDEPLEQNDEDFQARIRKADEKWEREQGSEDNTLHIDTGMAPPPPPKDIGYTPRSSTGPLSATFPPFNGDALHMSTSNDMNREVMAAGDGVANTPLEEQMASPKIAPPAPAYAPPPPPPTTSSPIISRSPFGIPEVPQIPASYRERETDSSEMSPLARKAYWPGTASSSTRPSVDSLRQGGPPSLPGAQSMSSVAGSARHSSIDADGADSQTKLVKTVSPGPEQKRLSKRKNIIKELLDTENSYHQDLKIIEDIYKATVGDLVNADDKRILFGNCDEIEQFSLHFYDELRRAVAPMYVPAKQMRWANKRGSYSTMQSDGTGQTSMMSSDSVDDEKDRATSIGRCFLTNLHRMDLVYGAYLKNHDAANQRLTVLKAMPTVKCWLDECHNNASDITSAWDLDSLLVKPTQRVAKYPLMLHQLLETTPSDHPDHDALKAAAKDAVGMLTRINEAKKRADLVDQIINGKNKDGDVRSGIAKAFGRRTEKLKERVGIAEAFQDAEFDELSHKFGGHFIRLQICMRDVQDYLHRIDKGMDQITNTAAALDLYTDVAPSSLPEIESKWRRYGQAVREISAIAFPDHKAAVYKRVVQPMITCIKLHEGPQNAINKRKKRIVDYAKCKSIEKRGEKPDKKTIEAAEMYMAINDQLKIDLPKLYSLTASLVQACLTCFLDIQLTWYNMWERKLKPILEESQIPTSIEQIEPAFRPDYDIVKSRLLELSICNGALLADSANFLSPANTIVADPELSLKRPSTLDSKRTQSISSDHSPNLQPINKRHSSGYVHGYDGTPGGPRDGGRIRSNSSLSTRGTPSQTPASGVSANRPWSSANTPSSSFSASRPSTANPQPVAMSAFQQPTRPSLDTGRSPRPGSGQTYFTARPELDTQRFSGLFSSALPPELQPEAGRPVTPTPETPDMHVMFVCASLFEFSIDKTRKEAGYPYLTYVQGEVFDVIAQKGELWLAKNQDDGGNMLGWIWEQHFVILSQES
ncbi:hypothetical protein LTR86_004947 [Recurvomyces mirabilis]|nr:hypothetical protein LTR86_004947 [Recurvomyces mirabilis]